jgi:hypothetical protein
MVIDLAFPFTDATIPREVYVYWPAGLRFGCEKRGEGSRHGAVSEAHHLHTTLQ